MLVLTRKCQQTVIVSGADGISILLKVTVLGIDNGKVRLGFEASDDVPVYRQEVWERIRDKAKFRSRTSNQAPNILPLGKEQRAPAEES
jgi:carbon storage regulator